METPTITFTDPKTGQTYTASMANCWGYKGNDTATKAYEKFLKTTTAAK